MAKPKRKVIVQPRRARAKLPEAGVGLKEEQHHDESENVEHKFEDAFFGFLLLLSVAMFALVLLSKGRFSESWAGPMVSGLSTAVFPLLVAFIVLSIGRELWVMRAYIDHIHISEVINERI
jgi:hypothetical protein